MTDWYVLQVTTGREGEIVRRLNEMGVMASAPERTMIERHHGKWMSRTRVVIPGYVFVGMDRPIASGDYYDWRGVPGVIRLLGMDNGLPLPVPDSQLMVIRTIMRHESLGVSHYAIDANGHRQYVDGPLAGELRAAVIAEHPRNRRATIAVRLLDDIKTVDLAIDALQAPQESGG